MRIGRIRILRFRIKFILEWLVGVSGAPNMPAAVESVILVLHIEDCRLPYDLGESGDAVFSVMNLRKQRLKQFQFENPNI